MATVWSGYSGGIAVGVDVSQSPSTVTSSTASVTLTWTIYARNDGTHGTGSYTWASSGAHTGSGSGSGGYPSWGRTWQVTQFTSTVATAYGSATSAALTASVTWTATGASPSLKRTVSVAARPPALPSAPTSVTVAPSGSNFVVSWTRPSNASSSATAWANAVVQRKEDDDSVAWHTVATLAGTANTWTDTAIVANHKYVYRVFGRNAAGLSAGPNSGWAAAPPAAPTGVTARRSGADILVTWTDNSPFNTSWTVQDSPNNGSTWTTVATAVGDAVGSAESWTHTAPDTSVTHMYRVAAVTTVPAWTTYSAASNKVTLIAPPAAPTGLGPSVIPTADPVAYFSWTPNATDTSDQTAYQVLWSTDSGATWTDTGKITSSDEGWSAVAAVASPGLVQWQVRTWGADPSPSPYSAVGHTTVSSSPAVTITAPGSTANASAITATWTYAQAEGSACTAWTAQISAGNRTMPDGSNGSGTSETSWTSGSVLQNSSSYTLSVTCTSAAGLTATATQDFTVVFDPPLTPIITLDDRMADGFIGVTVAAPSDGVAPDPIQLVLERSIDGGDWATLTQVDGDAITWHDYGCTLTGTNSYRASAISALPSMSQEVADYASPTLARRNVAILSAGDALTDVLRFSFALQSDLTSGQDVALNQFAGRTYPVATHGQARSRVLSVQAKLIYSADADSLEAQRDTVEAIFHGDGPVLYRDSLGRRFFCSLSQVQVPSAFMPEVSFTVTQVDPGSGIVEGVTA